MSLDFYLEAGGKSTKGSGIFVRENGGTVEISREEWDAKFPGREPVIADVESNDLFSANITHNLNRMADEAGIYNCLWRPDENGFERAGQIVEQLERGLKELESEPERFKPLSAKNGWGTYEQFVPWVKNVLEACKANPEALIRVSR